MVLSCNNPNLFHHTTNLKHTTDLRHIQSNIGTAGNDGHKVMKKKMSLWLIQVHLFCDKRKTQCC